MPTLYVSCLIKVDNKRIDNHNEVKHNYSATRLREASNETEKIIAGNCVILMESKP